MSEFGVLIKKLRKDKGVTLDYVATRVGTHKGYISGIENGKVNPPSVKFIKRIARVLKTDEKNLVRIAYIDKIPAIIKKDIAKVIRPSASSVKKAAASLFDVPLLNTVNTGLPTEIDAQGNLVSLTDAMAVLPKLRHAIECLLVVCDDAMESDDPFRSLPKGEPFGVTKTERPAVGDCVFALYTRDGKKRAAIRFLQSEANGKIVLHANNERYGDETIERDDIDALLKVVVKPIYCEDVKRHMKASECSH